jgi:hypothetical protein
MCLIPSSTLRPATVSMPGSSAPGRVRGGLPGVTHVHVLAPPTNVTKTIAALTIGPIP